MALTPMMQQYLDIKQQYQDVLLMFRLGDFYELFLDDAITASKALDITLTGRDAGAQGRIPMCGVPHHAVDQYIERLIEQGHSVAICEQVEDPKSAKGLVKRDVVRVVTPGTLVKDEGTSRRILASFVVRRLTAGVGFADVATGDLWYTEVSPSQLMDLLVQWQPTEVLLYESELDNEFGQAFEEWVNHSPVRVTRRRESRDATEAAVQTVCKQFHVPSLAPLDLDNKPVGAEALGLILGYIEETQKLQLVHFRTPKDLSAKTHLVVDYTASKNLELVETARTRQKKGSLYGLLDVTKTAMGSRLLRTWIERPLMNLAAIEQRLNAVAHLCEDMFLREALKELLNQVYDLDRLAGRISFGTANARDLRAIAQSLMSIPDLRALLEQAEDELLQSLATELPDLSPLREEIERTIVEQPPVGVKDGGIIQPGVDGELDNLRSINSSAKEWLANLEQQERERTGIRTLKIGFNKVFGYYIEVSKASTHLVPPEYERRQTLASGERYTLQTLKEQESRILNAAERAVEREYELFADLREQTLQQLPLLQQAAERLATTDVLCAFATISVQYGYTRPAMVEDRRISIVQGRHPVVEAAAPGSFVPNDVELGKRHDLILLTGPNMAGKSTYMRQSALIVLMAHMGCFVPARSAEIGRIDRIFTRIGASDDLSGGQSTFMVEMVELAQILRQSTQRSLVLLDEIGRGTSTYDGMSIAEAVMEALLAEGRRPLTLFATHYHELTSKVDGLERAANYSVVVRETEEGISFLHTVVDRPADKSYGIQVAKLAGIPEPIIERANALLRHREDAVPVSGKGVSAEVAAATENPATNQGTASHLPLFGWREEALLAKLADIQTDTLTPIEALLLLDECAKEAREVAPWDKSKSSPRS